MAGDDAELRRSLVRVLREMVGMLGADWAALSARLTSVAHDLEVAPPGPLDGELLRRVQRLPRGTMGGLSDVMCGAPQGGRWVPPSGKTEPVVSV